MLGEMAANVGMGMAAGFAGTVAMTGAQLIEMRITKRAPSSSPAKAVEKVLAIRPQNEKAESRLSWLTHFAYGTAWGGARGLLPLLGKHGFTATFAHWASVQSTEYAILPALKIAPPVTKWGAKPAATDMLFHLTYALTTGLVFEALFEALRRDAARAAVRVRIIKNEPD